MSARRNAILVRYKVFIEDDDTASGGSGGGGVIPVDDIIAVSGLTLGEEGTVTVPEWDRDTEISNGKRKLMPLGLKYKLKGNNLPTFKFFSDWWANRNTQIKKIRVEICDRRFSTLSSTPGSKFPVTRWKTKTSALQSSAYGKSPLARMTCL